MANTRTRLLKLLANAEQALAEAESLAAELPESEHAVKLLAELRDAVKRIERLLK